MDSESQHIGEWICDGNVQLLRVIGTGSYAQVYLAYHSSLKKHVAVKCLEKNSLLDKQLWLLREEISIHSQLGSGKHLNIVQFIQSWESETTFFIVMEYCGGMDLFDLAIVRDGLDDSTTKKIFSQLLDAVEYCHNMGIYHRDIKPENCLTVNGTLKLADFGLATRELMTTEFGVGSFPYMSPESMLKGSSEKEYNARVSDVWSLGVILFSLRFARALWSQPSIEDAGFAEFVRDPMTLKRTFKLTPQAYHLALSVFTLNPQERCSIQQLRGLLDRISLFQEPESIPKLIFISPSNKKSIGAVSADSAISSFASSWGDDDSEMDYSSVPKFDTEDDDSPIDVGEAHWDHGSFDH